MKNRVGEKYITNEGYEIEIIEYFGVFKCTIRFNNGISIKNKVYSAIIKGCIKNPYHLSVFGVGYLGIGLYNKTKHLKIYSTWKDMLERCYSQKTQEKHTTYKECSVSEEWYNFQNFAEWMDKNYNYEIMQKWHLDKDILFKGNKIYSPERCAFVPQEINVLFCKSNSIRGVLPIGVSLCRNKKSYRVQITINNKNLYIGTYNTVEEAFQVYKITKETYIKKVADKWKDKITEKVYEALINYRVEIID